MLPTGAPVVQVVLRSAAAEFCKRRLLLTPLRSLAGSEEALIAAQMCLAVGGLREET